MYLLPNIPCPLVVNENPTRKMLRDLGIPVILIHHLKNIWMRSRLSEAQNHRCAHCHRMTTEIRGKPNSSTIDHYQCKVDGGKDIWENYVMACSKCNQRRGPIDIEIFYNLMQIPDPQKRSAAIRVAYRAKSIEIEARKKAEREQKLPL